jgi:hypothetical protein
MRYREIVQESITLEAQVNLFVFSILQAQGQGQEQCDWETRGTVNPTVYFWV